MGARKVIDKFGSQTALAALIGKGQSTIAYWVKINFIPEKWHQILLDLAKQEGIYLTKNDFLIDVESNVISHDNKILHSDKSSGGELVPRDEVLDAINSHFLFYASDNGSIKIQVIVGDETVWASQKSISEIFDTSRENVTTHLTNIFSSNELEENAVCKECLLTGSDGKKYKYKMYNLDAIISVGYRVNSYQATQFRKWATGVLKEYLIKGFVLDDERLKQGGQLFGKDYFDELLERVREIRASERRFYQKITDIYAQCSVDYNKDSPITYQFYAHVQDKLHYAITGNTSAELIYKRADASKPQMGLLTYKNSGRGGKITKLDAKIGKNYLIEKELDGLNRLVSMYLDFAENFAIRHIPMRMKDWAEKLDDFLRFNAYEVLDGFGHVSRDTADAKAFAEYEKFRVIQDKEFKSDFDRVVGEIKIKKRLPSRGDS